MIFPPNWYCSCVKKFDIKAVAVREHLITKEEACYFPSQFKGDVAAIKRALEQFDVFEYYAIAYRCPEGHVFGTHYDWQYCEDEAEIIGKEYGEFQEGK